MTILRHTCDIISSRKTLCLAIAVAAASFVSMARADSTSNPEEEFTQRWYIGGGIGHSQLQPNPRQPEILTVGDDSDTGFHLNLGYDLNRWLSAELYFSSLGEAVLDRIDAGNEQAALDSIDYLTLDVAAVAYLFNTKSGFAWSDETDGLYCREALSVYGRVSLGIMRNDNSENQIRHGRNYNQHVGFGAGLEYGFNNGFAVRGELISFDSDARYTNIALVKRFGESHCERTTTAVKGTSETKDPVTPYVPPPPPPPTPLPAVVPPTSYFGFDTHVLDESRATELSQFSEQILYRPGTVELTGHTDSKGSNTYNTYLSEQRVLEVRRILIENRVAPSRIRVRHLGETSPVSANDTKEGRALNRRVNIEFVPD